MAALIDQTGWFGVSGSRLPTLEPSSGLDPLVQREFQAMMAEVAAEGRTVFLSSHTLSEVQRAAHRVGIIRQGRLIAVEGVHDVRSKAIRRVDIYLDTEPTADLFAGVEGVRDVRVDGTHVSLSFDGHMAELLTTAGRQGTVVDISTQEADLEEIFLAYYRDDPAP